MSANCRKSFRNKIRTKISVAIAFLFLLQITAAYTGAYDLGTTVADMRQDPSLSGGTACPQLTRFDDCMPASINRQWSTSLGAKPSHDPHGGPDSAADKSPKSMRSFKLRSRCGQAFPAALLTPSTLGTLQQTWRIRQRAIPRTE